MTFYFPLLLRKVVLATAAAVQQPGCQESKRRLSHFETRSFSPTPPPTPPPSAAEHFNHPKFLWREFQVEISISPNRRLDREVERVPPYQRRTCCVRIFHFFPDKTLCLIFIFGNQIWLPFAHESPAAAAAAAQISFPAFGVSSYVKLQKTGMPTHFNDLTSLAASGFSSSPM